MNCSKALKKIKSGQALARKSWDGKDMFVFLAPSVAFNVHSEPLLSLLGAGAEVFRGEHIALRSGEERDCVWSPLQVDMFANDWQVVLETGPQ